MNKTKSLIALLLVCSSLVAFKAADKAPVTRIGYVNAQALLNELPEMKVGSGQLVSFSEALNAELDRKMLEYQKKAEAFQSEQAHLDSLIRTNRMAELESMAASIDQFRKSSLQSIQKKNDDLLNPMKLKVQEAIAAVANELGYTHVLNGEVANSTLFLYANDLTDLNDLVRERLGSMQQTMETTQK